MGLSGLIEGNKTTVLFAVVVLTCISRIVVLAVRVICVYNFPFLSSPPDPVILLGVCMMDDFAP